MKKEKERKRVGIKYLKTKGSTVLGLNPSAILYIGILVTSTTTGHGGSVVSALHSQAKGRGSISSCGRAFSPTSIFLLPFPTSVE